MGSRIICRIVVGVICQPEEEHVHLLVVDRALLILVLLGVGPGVSLGDSQATGVVFHILIDLPQFPSNMAMLTQASQRLPQSCNPTY